MTQVKTCAQVQYHWGNMDAIYSSPFHSGPELDRERNAHVEATNVLRACMEGFRAAPGIEQVVTTFTSKDLTATDVNSSTLPSNLRACDQICPTVQYVSMA